MARKWGMPSAARRIAEQRKHKARLWGAAGAAILGILTFILPHTEFTTAWGLVIAFFVLVPLALNGYQYKAKWYVLTPLLVMHACLLGALGWWIWPRIQITPHSVRFSAYAEQRYDFAVSNPTEDDYYQIHIPIKASDQVEDNFGLRIWNDPLDSRPLAERVENANEFSFCIDRKTRQPFILINLLSLKAHQTRNFTLIHKGPAMQAAVGKPITQEDPMPYDKSEHSESAVFSVPSQFTGCHVNLGQKDVKE